MQGLRFRSSLSRGRWFYVVLLWSTSSCAALAVLTGLFWFLVFGDGFHRLEHHRLATATHFTQAAPMAVVRQLQDYFRSSGGHLLEHRLFSYRERRHYQEVKRALRTLQCVCMWTLLAFAGGAGALAAQTRHEPCWCRALTAVVCGRMALLLITVSLGGGLCLTSFDTYFVHLHRLLFHTDSWLLPPYAATVRLFPVQYFFDFALVYLALVLSAAVVLGVIAWWATCHSWKLPETTQGERMSYQTVVRLLCWSFVLCIGSAAPATAEWFVDLYGGYGFIQRDDISIMKDTTDAGISTNAIDASLHNVDFDDMLSGGLRVGYWFPSSLGLGFELGLGLDVFYYPLQVPTQTVRATSNVDIDLAIEDTRVEIAAGEDLPLSLPKVDPEDSAVASIELMVRRPFGISPAFPHGRWQPYLTIAPALLFTDDKPKLTVGVKAGAGLAWQVHKHVALLTEYRFTHFRFETSRATLLVDNTIIEQPTIETDLNTHFILAGLSIRF